MPLREYQCRECGHVQEVLQLPGAPEPNAPGRCQKCETWACMELVISAPGQFNLKGAGFHCNDYKNKRRGPQPKTQVAVGKGGDK